MMPARLALLLLLPALAGCVAGESNPNLLAPKVVLDALPDGEVTLYVHSAFGDRRYDRIEVSIDNETLAVREDAFSLEETVDRSRFFLSVEAVADGAAFRLQGVFGVEEAPPVDGAADEPELRLDVALLDAEGEWTDARTYALPYERILDRPQPAREASA